MSCAVRRHSEGVWVLRCFWRVELKLKPTNQTKSPRKGLVEGRRGNSPEKGNLRPLLGEGTIGGRGGSVVALTETYQQVVTCSFRSNKKDPTSCNGGRCGMQLNKGKKEASLVTDASRVGCHVSSQACQREPRAGPRISEQVVPARTISVPAGAERWVGGNSSQGKEKNFPEKGGAPSTNWCPGHKGEVDGESQ